jgi:DNA-binding SARP family transcriptional activator
MELHLLGPIEATVDGRRIALGATKQRAVLAMLALPPNRTVSVDRLIDGLWGEEAPDSAAKMVQLYVSQLRKLLAGNGAEIVTHGRGYELRLAPTAVDVARFEHLSANGSAREALAL